MVGPFPCGGPVTTLINVSGGIDSALVLHQAVQSGRKVLAHHIVLETRAGRHVKEAEAVPRILEWVGGDVEYVESRFGWGDLERVRDVHVWALFTGAILFRRPEVDEVGVCSHLDSFTRYDEHWRERCATVLEGFVQLTAGRQPRWWHPLARMTKADIVAACPPELFELAWWCRTPVGGNRCHRCLTCRQVSRALQKRS